MRYLLAAEIAEKWKVSERSVRNYCAQERVNGAFLIGKTWSIPENAEKPERTNKRREQPQALLGILQDEKLNKVLVRKCVGKVISLTPLPFLHPYYCGNSLYQLLPMRFPSIA